MQLALSIHRRTKIALAAFGLLAALAMAVASPQPAHAAGCATLGHAYYIDLPSGFNYMSGFEKDVRYGVPSVTVHRGQSYQLGGNGIKPNTSITFRTAQGIFGQFGNQAQTTTAAGSNCVVNQNPNGGFISFSAPLGTHRVKADYQVPSRAITGDPVVDLNIIP